MNKKKLLALGFLFSANSILLPDQKNNERKDLVSIPYAWAVSQMQKGKPRPSSYPYIAGDSFRAHADHIIDNTIDYFDPSTIKSGDIVYVFTPLLHTFFNKIHPRIEGPYVLITTNADNAVPADYHYDNPKCASGDFTEYLDDPKLLAWFGRNATGKHPKLFPIPIGLLNAAWHIQGNTKTIEKVRNKNLPKKHLLYNRITVKNNKEAREPVARLFANKPFCYSPKGWRQYPTYLHDLASSKFVLSPKGYGIDCHRTWEALMVGSIPIIISSPLDEIYKDLPVIIVNDWNEVTEEFLHKKYEKFKQRTFNLEKMYMPYWIDKIEKVKAKKILIIAHKN